MAGFQQVPFPNHLDQGSAASVTMACDVAIHFEELNVRVPKEARVLAKFLIQEQHTRPQQDNSKHTQLLKTNREAREQ